MSLISANARAAEVSTHKVVDKRVVNGEDVLAVQYATDHPDECARITWAESHFWLAFLVFDAVLFFSLHGFQFVLAASVLTVTLCLFVCIAFRLVLVLSSILWNPTIRVSDKQIESLSTEELPLYTILVPLYKEAEVAAGIVASLAKLRYPRESLDIKLLLEEDDSITRAAVDQLDLPPEFHVILIPPGKPRTKPKACNYGLAEARGEYVVVFDAEDRPESDQLLKVLAAFRDAKSNVACIQAKLNYFNPRDNYLTKSFALEYTAWFDMMLPGIQLLNGPIPLGGTSNHFRTKVLQDLRGWDPYNVTEDCDLGVRLSKHGYQTIVIESTTWEEANMEVGNWIRQRSRWTKGYLQTCLIHTKRPFGIIRRLGFRRAMLFHLCVTSVPIQLLCVVVCLPFMLLYGTLLVADLAAGRTLWQVVAGSRDEYRFAWKLLFLEEGESPIWSAFSVVGFFATISMMFASVFFVLINVLACFRRGYRDLLPIALLSPLYWLLGSIASWKGAIQLISRPHYWEKTTHGLSASSANHDGEFVSEKVSHES